jgi:hypothetical protein
MTKRFIGFLVALGAATVFAQEGGSKPVEGTVTLDKKTYTLKHALAYETTTDDEEAIAVVLSGQAISGEQLTEAREADKEGGDPNFTRPFLRLVFTKTGDIKHWSAAAGGTSIGRRSGTATGELKQQDGRVIGKAAVANDPQGMFPTSFDVRFETALLKAGDSLPVSTARKGGPAASVTPTVTGTFTGNGKEAKLAHVSAHWREPFSGKQGMALVFTEKDHSKEKKPDTGAMFGRFGSALIISVHEDGGIYGCQVVHSAHQKQGFSSIGSIEATEFTYADGKVEGELTTHGEKDTFGEKWDVKIKFVAPLGETPKEFQVAETKKMVTETKPTASAPDDDDEGEAASDESGAKTTGAEPKAKDLALTKDATAVEYKALVEQLAFKSASDVKKVCAELTAALKAQGWSIDGRDMVNPQSSILRRTRGEAKLTIFVKPADGGSEVKMMTEGLSWD